MNEPSKIILFGGTFDPIHNGHLGVARHALQMLGGNRLIFVPARQSPHKKQPPTDGAHRLAMIWCAIEGEESLSVSDCELKRVGPSYTIETIRYFRQQTGPEAELYWLIGADQLEDLPKWYRVEELLAACHLCTMVRGGYGMPDTRRFEGVFSPECIERLRGDILLTPEIPISGTEIREQLKQGRIEPGVVPERVLEYIRRQGLYGYADS
jgi:nicotinate-nucleotide adenylyltransferase